MRIQFGRVGLPVRGLPWPWSSWHESVSQMPGSIPIKIRRSGMLSWPTCPLMCCSCIFAPRHKGKGFRLYMVCLFLVRQHHGRGAPVRLRRNPDGRAAREAVGGQNASSHVQRQLVRLFVGLHQIAPVAQGVPLEDALRGDVGLAQGFQGSRRDP